MCRIHDKKANFSIAIPKRLGIFKSGDGKNLSLTEKMKNQAAVMLGRLGGKSTSAAKTRAARENAKLGGWPKGKPRKLKNK